jgi:pimeloyl-ACP methyl ester carboxylesterase
MTYIDVHGHPTWVLDEGSGEVLLLLHGGFSESTPLFELLRPMQTRYRVVAFDRRGHGKTEDTDEAFHYETMAHEAIGVLEQLGGTPAHVLGYSDGGGVALWLAHLRPDLVRSMILVGAGFHHRGLSEDWIDASDPQYDAMLATSYAAKDAAMYTTEPTFTVDDLAGMTMPVLAIVGDDDCIDLDHVVELYRALPNGQLAVVPAASHLVALEKPALFTTLVDDFLTSGGAVRTILPIRRRNR